MESMSASVLKVLRATLLVAAVLTHGGTTMADPNPVPKLEPQRITLVGASIGNAWKFPQIGKRLSLAGYEFDYVGQFDFDKSASIAGILNRSTKPDFVLIKECSTYFPGDQAKYRQRIVSWIDQLRSAGIQPILVTTAPLGEPSGYIEKAKSIVKRLLGRPAALDEVTAFNDWLKEYGRQQSLPLFDLEAVLRRSSSDRWMKPEYDSGDRVHLTGSAYDAMDRAFASFLSGLPTRGGKQPAH